MVKLITIIFLIAITGCSTITKREKVVPPSVSTTKVIESLTSTKEIIVEAGDQNTVVGQKIDKAIVLAEKLELLLQQIETENNKNVIKHE